MRSARWASKKTYGAGKSTLLRIIAGLETPDIGQLRIDATAPGRPEHVPGLTGRCYGDGMPGADQRLMMWQKAPVR